LREEVNSSKAEFEKVKDEIERLRTLAKNLDED